ncbi:MAG: hypothetical protein HY907_01925 [Deltaproteobacteria bacterium]|nr:hypothetical protein [Deltaproteobacteria bacterium]
MKRNGKWWSVVVLGAWTAATACTVDRGESINAGAGLIDEQGGVAVDPTQVPVVSGCDENEFVRMGAGGVWECAGVTSSGGGDITGVAAGDGLTGGGSTGEVSLGVDSAAVPVVDSCAEGEYVRLGAAGLWECGELPPPSTGDITGVTAGTGLTGGGSSGDVSLEVDAALVPMVGACPTGEFVRSAGSGAWECAAVTSSAGGDITAVAAGEGMSGGGNTGDVTLDVAFGGSGTAPIAARADHSHAYVVPVDLSGMIAFFAGPCPAGWTEYQALRGRFIVGTPSGGTDEGEFGAAQTDLGSDSHQHGYSDVPQHSHAVNPPSTTTSTDGSHTHPIQVSGNGGSGINGLLWGDPGAWVSINAAGAHAHTVDTAPFSSDPAGVATPATDPATNTPPYLQLRACRKD